MKLLQSLKRTNYLQQTKVKLDHLINDFDNYHIPQARMHLQFHDWGVVQGFDVSTLAPNKLEVTTGLAINEEGRLLVLPEDREIEIEVDEEGLYYLVADWKESPQDDETFLEELKTYLKPSGTVPSSAIVLAIVAIDDHGDVTITDRHQACEYARRMVRERTEAVEFVRTLVADNQIRAAAGGRIGPGHNGGLEVTVPEAGDHLVVASKQGNDEFGQFAKFDLYADKTDLRGALHVAKAVTLDQELAVDGNVTIGKQNPFGPVTGTLTVQGAAELKNALTVAEDVMFEKKLTVQGATTLGGNVTIGKLLTPMTDALTVNGTVTLKKTLDVTDSTTVGKGLTVKGAAIFKGNVGIGTLTPRTQFEVTEAIAASRVIEIDGYTDPAKGVTPTITSGVLWGGGPTFRDRDNCWRTGEFPSSLEIDLGAIFQQLHYIAFGTLWRTDRNVIPRAYSIDISGSEDKSSWTRLVTVTDNTNSRVIHALNTGPVRWVRLNVEAPQPGRTFVHISGFQVLVNDGGALAGRDPWAIGPDGHATLATIRNVGIGTANPQAKLQVSGGAIMPSVGKDENAGIIFPKNPGGGASDAAWIRYYSRGGESTTFEIGTSNDADDHIAFMSSGNVGIGTHDPKAKLHIVHTPQNANGNTLILGPTDGANLRFGYHTDYSWIQSHGSKPLAINPVGNNVGIGTTQPVFGRLMIEDISVPLALRETGQDIAAGGLWRMPLDGGVLRFDVNTDKSPSEFAHYNTPLAMTKEGRVGIGSIAPPATLTVDDLSPVNTNWNTAAFRKAALGPHWSHIHWGPTGDWYIRSASSQGKIILQDSGGNVGIGTVDPQQKLHVAGNFIRVDGADNEQAYIGGDGDGNDVQLGSFNKNVSNVSLWNPGNGTYMNLVAKDLTVNGKVNGRAIVTDGDNLDRHLTNKGNPHGVTPDQIGALPLSGGFLNGRLGVGGDLLVDGTISSTKALLPDAEIGHQSHALLDEWARVLRPEEAKLLFYNFGNGNWAGIGVASNGRIWIRAGWDNNPNNDKTRTLVLISGDGVVSSRGWEHK